MIDNSMNSTCNYNGDLELVDMSSLQKKVCEFEDYTEDIIREMNASKKGGLYKNFINKISSWIA